MTRLEGILLEIVNMFVFASLQRLRNLWNFFENNLELLSALSVESAFSY